PGGRLHHQRPQVQAAPEPGPDAERGRVLQPVLELAAEAGRAEGGDRPRAPRAGAAAARARPHQPGPRPDGRPGRHQVRGRLPSGSRAPQRQSGRRPPGRLPEGEVVPGRGPGPASSTTAGAACRPRAIESHLKLRYIPLGGLGEVGRNMWALEWDNQVLVVDAGLMFPHEEMHGVDLVIPDISYLLQPGKKVLGIVLTHGHEDHIGALPFVLKRLNVPVYSARLTLSLAKPKLKEHRILREADLREVRIGDRFQLGPFSVEMIAVCHSIPDATALAIKTPVGMVIYTGDFKLDDDPPEGR